MKAYMLMEHFDKKKITKTNDFVRVKGKGTASDCLMSIMTQCLFHKDKSLFCAKKPKDMEEEIIKWSDSTHYLSKYSISTLFFLNHNKFFPFTTTNFFSLFIGSCSLNKLDGVGPVDNRPSTNKLHHFVRKKKKRKKSDM